MQIINKKQSNLFLNTVKVKIPFLRFYSNCRSPWVKNHDSESWVYHWDIARMCLPNLVIRLYYVTGNYNVKYILI
jgi:hypothetical protein